MDGHRRAALALHGLQEPDRDWILAQLAATERAPLDPLLQELRGLGIAPDAAMIGPIVAAKGQAPEPAAPQTPRDRIRAASAARIRELLAGEPPAVAASLIAIEPWPWRASLLARMPRRRRAEVSRAIPAAARRGPRFADTLVAALDARLAGGEAPGALRHWADRITRCARALKPWTRK